MARMAGYRAGRCTPAECALGGGAALDSAAGADAPLLSHALMPPPPPLPGWVQAWEQAGSVELLGAADARLASETEADKQHRWGRGRTEFCFWGGGGSGFGAVMLLEQQ
jgi:hypothetical protein